MTTASKHRTNCSASWRYGFVYWCVLIAGVVMSLGGVMGEEANADWNEADTRLANQYVQMLYSKPDDPRVLGLLWDHYEAHGETALLLDFFEQAARAEDVPSISWYLYGELLRRGGDVESAQAWFRKLVVVNEWEALALTGLAQLALETNDVAGAVEHVERLVESPGLTEDTRLGMLESLANLYVEAGESERALSAWERLLEASVGDLALPRRVARKMMASGYFEEAAAAYEKMREGADADVRMEVLVELARLYESAGEFEKAAAALEEGRAATHFKHHRHQDFLAKLVRLYESGGRLRELEKRLMEAAEVEAPSEAALHSMVRFYDFTASPLKREEWLRRMVERMPERGEYLGEYVEVLMENDEYAEAKAQLERLLGEGSAETLAMRLMRVRVELRLEGRDAGSALLREYLEEKDLSDEEISDVVNFAEVHYLDDLAGELLVSEQAVLGEEAVFRLAELHYSRGRLKEAREVLEGYAEAVSGEGERYAQRLVKVASVYQGMALEEAARDFLEKAVTIRPADVGYRMLLGGAYAETGDIDAAVEQYEMAWQLSTDAEGRLEADQRLISLLELESFEDRESAKASVEAGVESRESPSLRPFSVPTAVPNQGEMSFEELQVRLQQMATGMPLQQVNEEDPLVKYFVVLREKAREEGEAAMLFRVAWWARRLAQSGRFYDYATAYEMLRGEGAEMPQDAGAVELLLEVAEATGNTVLQERMLEQLIAWGGERGWEAMLERAKLPLTEEGHEREVIEMLDELAAERGVGSNVLEEVARVYEQLGLIDVALRVMEQAFAGANAAERRRMIEALTALHVKAGDIEQALDAHTRMIEGDTDILARRKALARQVRMASRGKELSRLEEAYRELTRRHPLEAFYPEALARVLEAMGRSSDAFAMAKKAYYSSRSEDDALLELLRRLAAATRDVEAAVYYQRQLLAKTDSESGIAEWRKLIDMLELNFDVEEADRIRVRLEGKFGNEPEVLNELAQQYLGSRQPEAGRRLYERMVKLRPWDVGALFTLATLHEFTGNEEEAARLYLGVIGRAEEKARQEAAEGDVIVRLPLRGFSREARPEWNNGLRQLEGLVTTLDTVRVIDNRLRVQVATHYLESARPELQAIPDEAAVLRLRAIEQLGELFESDRFCGETRREWEQYWTEHEPVSVEEAFWVAYCGGDWERAWGLLEEGLFMRREGADRMWAFVEQRDWPTRLAGPRGQGLTLPEFISQDFIYCLYGARMGRIEELISWVEGSEGEYGVRRNRAMWLLTAVYALGRTGEHFVSDEELRMLMGSDVLKGEQSSIYHLVQQLRQAGQDGEAYRLATAALGEHSRFGEQYYYLMGELARAAGDERGEERYFEMAMREMEPSHHEYWRPVQELAGVQESDVDRRRLISRALDRVSQATPDGNVEMVRGHLLRLAGDRVGASEAIGRLVDIQLGRSRGMDRSAVLTGAGSATVWSRMLNYASRARMTGLAEEARAPFSEALGEYELLAPRTEEAAERFHQFLQYQLMWEFEGLTYPARRSLLRSYLALLGERSGRQGFARILTINDFFRDTIVLYEGLLDSYPDDNDVARNFFDACQRSHDYEPALAYLERIREGQTPKPEGMQDEYLVRQHSYFLWLAKDVPGLRLEADRHLAQVPHISVEGRWYHTKLASLLMDMGDYEGALAVYEEIDDLLHKSIKVLEPHALVLRELGRLEEAAVVLERVNLNGNVPSAERVAIRELAALYGKMEKRDDLMELAGRAIDSGSDEVIIAVAESMAEAEMRGEAMDLILLGSRRLKSDGERTRLLLELMARIVAGEEREGGKDWGSLLETVFACGVANEEENRRRLLEILRGGGERVPEEWKQFLANGDGGAGLMASVCRLELAMATGEADVEAMVEEFRGVQSSEDADYVRLAIEASLEHGRPVVAKDLLEILRAAQPSLYSHAEESIAVHAALEDEAGLALIFQDLLRDGIEEGVRGRTTMLVERGELAGAFANAGQVERALRLYEHYSSQPLTMRREDREFYENYARLLVRERRYFDAERVIRRGMRKNVEFDVAVLIELYERWGKLGQVERELNKFKLSSGLRKKVEFMAIARERDHESVVIKDR
ncbi:MAG: hypothetical protein AAGD22_12560 [Verrucomicrobiota bacterium]